jgi:hypothetical protein
LPQKRQNSIVEIKFRPNKKMSRKSYRYKALKFFKKKKKYFHKKKERKKERKKESVQLKVRKSLEVNLQ